jgi:hypothetical protein
MRYDCVGFRREYLDRREALLAGGLTLAGLGLADLLGARAAAGQPAAGFGRARSCIVLFMTGGPSHLDTWDPKPHLPAEYRGEFKPAATDVVGVRICEHFRRLARLAGRYAIVRSMTHGDSNHNSGPHALLTGKPSARPGRGPGPGEWPTYGSVLARLGRGGRELPPFVRLRPSVRGGPEDLAVQSQGAGAGWLGRACEPFSLDGDLARKDYRGDDFVLRADLSRERLEGRRELLRDIDRQADQLGKRWERSGQAHHERAYSLLAAPGTRRAFDLSQEPDRVRDRYGRNLHGHSVLLARRLVEAGVPLVTVFYQNDPVGGEDSTAWDTHGGNFPLLKNLLMPQADLALSALLEDLDARGLLDETLIVWAGEFGRAPKISKPGAGTTNNLGRDHWPRCFSAVLAGGGIKGGQAFGSSDRLGAYPKESPVSPADLAATIYHCLGVKPDHMIPDPLGRPHAICEGKPIAGLLG